VAVGIVQHVLADQHAGLDGLAEPHLVRQQIALYGIP
jgi:hypothetical protein